mgnify:CR=1 FL=1
MQRALTVALIVLGVWALVSWSAPGAPADPDAAAAWQADLGPALEQARREGKDVLVDFTGSDWCGWCTRLHDEVFGRAGFVDAVAGDFVLVALDFPRAGGRAWEAMPAALRERNAREARAFGVSGFPTVLLMTPEGVAYARSGYREGGAAAYAEHVEALRAPFDRDAMWDSWNTLRSWTIAALMSPLYEDPEKRQHLNYQVCWEVEQGLALSAMDVHRASVIRSDWFKAVTVLFDQYDVLALPSAQMWPFDVDIDWPREIAGTAMDTYHRWMEVVIPASLIGLPAVCVPAGFGGTHDLPMGLQLIGRRGTDAKLLRLAEAWHSATNWPARRPPKL